MMHDTYEDAYYRWTWHVAHVRDGRGPERVEKADKPDPTFKPRPAGFTATLEPVGDPLLWEGAD